MDQEQLIEYSTCFQGCIFSAGVRCSLVVALQWIIRIVPLIPEDAATDRRHGGDWRDASAGLKAGLGDLSYCMASGRKYGAIYAEWVQVVYSSGNFSPALCAWAGGRFLWSYIRVSGGDFPGVSGE